MPAIAFSFAKKAEPKRVVEALAAKKDDGRVSIVGVESGKVTVDGPAEAETQLSIPCKNPLAEPAPRSKLVQKAPSQPTLQEGIESQQGGLLARNVAQLSAEDAEAVQALCQEAGAQGGDDIAKASVAPILMRTGSKGVRDGVAPEATKDMYESVPVEHFGMALLRGMGYDPEKHTTKPVFRDKLRDTHLGLGAKALLPSEKYPAKAKAKSSSSAAGKAALAAPANEVADSVATVEAAQSVPEPPPEKRRRTDGTEEQQQQQQQQEQQQQQQQQQQQHMPQQPRQDSEDMWPSRGLVVRVCGREKHLREFKGCEAVVLEADETSSCCRIKARQGDRSHVLQAVPVSSLETVLSAECQQVRVVRGPHRGAVAELLHRSERRGVVRVQVDKAKMELPSRDVCEFIPSKR